MVSNSSSVVDEVLDVKHQQLALLFSIWDTDACGRVHVRHVQSILRAVFPDEDEALFSTANVRRAYVSVTGRSWQAAQSDARFCGPTLNDMKAMLHHLGCPVSRSPARDGTAVLARRAVNAELEAIAVDVRGSDNATGTSGCADTLTRVERHAVEQLLITCTTADNCTTHRGERDLVAKLFPVEAS